jgi:hypothetical protein
MRTSVKRLTAAAAGGLTAVVPAVVMVSPQAQAATGPSGLWNFSVAAGSSTVADIDGSPQNISLKGSWSRGTGYVSFNAAPAYGQANGSTFSPGDLEFAFGAVLRTTSVLAKSNPNVIQGGMGNDPGQFKIALQPVNGGSAICVLKGTRGYMVAKSTRTGLANGASHEVVCSRQAGSISIAVDGYVNTYALSPGTIRLSSGRPLYVGGKGSTTTWTDQFRGQLDCAGVVSGLGARAALMAKMPC